MKNYLTIGIAAALIVSTGVVHGFWTGGFDFILGKPSASEQRAVFADRLKTVPKEVGNWVGDDLEPMDGRTREVANVDYSLERSYKNVRTGANSSVFIVSGHFRDIAVHTPDQCYVAAGYEMLSDPIKYVIETPAGSVEAYTTVFKKDDHHTEPHYLRVFWTWSFDGNWVAPNSPRIEFVGQPALYKMYIISQLQQPLRSTSEDLSVGFANQFVPALNRALFPGASNAAIGSDPENALEPAATATDPAATTPPVTVPIMTVPATDAAPPAAVPSANGTAPPVESPPAAVPPAAAPASPPPGGATDAKPGA
ncbi:MAG TPA: exosortase-associated EpsI family protein [Pirellulales bacterium]|jgi:hypothetical protein